MFGATTQVVDGLLEPLIIHSRVVGSNTVSPGYQKK